MPIHSLREATRKQEAIANQITERLLAGQPKIDAFDRMLDELQKQCEAMRQELDQVSTRKKAAFKPFTLNPSLCKLMTKALTMAVRAGKSEHDAVKEHFNVVRELVQKVVVTPSPDGKSADLTIHGRLATILASMARAWLRGQEWQRMATLVLNALLVPVAFSVIRGNGALVGVPVLLLAVTGVTAALLAGSSTPD